MPTYQYKCDACDVAYEDDHLMSEPHPTMCPACGEPYGERFGQDYANYNQIGIVKGNPTTLGQQAELNAKRLGKEQMQKMVEAEKQRISGWKGHRPKGSSVNTTGNGETPWFRAGEVPGLKKLDKPLNLKKIKDKKKYIATGETT
jgi:putative FmdB family regulatory protein